MAIEKTLFLTIFDLRSSIVLTVSTAAYPMCCRYRVGLVLKMFLIIFDILWTFSIVFVLFRESFMVCI